MKCRICETEVTEETLYCPNCGEKLNDVTVENVIPEADVNTESGEENIETEEKIVKIPQKTRNLWGKMRMLRLK